MGMVSEFKEFAMKGSVMDLAIGVVIGGAFQKIVDSMVNDIIMPLVGVVLGGVDFTGLNVTVNDAVVAYGNFIQALIHNGIIENYATLKEALLKLGHTFISETDTEVLVHLIEGIQSSENLELDEAVRIALTKVIGAYAIVVIDKLNPDILVAARKGSPLVVGLGENEYFIGSDATPIIDYTKKVIYLQDEEIAIIKNGRLQIKDKLI